MQKTIRAVAAVLVASGALMFLGRWGSYKNAPMILSGSAAVAGIWIALLVAAQLAVPILKIVTGFGLYGLKSWAWRAAPIVLGADVFTLGVSILRFHGIGFVGSGAPAPGAEGTEIVKTASIFPVYIVVCLSLASLIVLCSKPVRTRRRAVSISS